MNEKIVNANSIFANSLHRLAKRAAGFTRMEPSLDSKSHIFGIYKNRISVPSEIFFTRDSLLIPELDVEIFYRDIVDVDMIGQLASKVRINLAEEPYPEEFKVKLILQSGKSFVLNFDGIPTNSTGWKYLDTGPVTKFLTDCAENSRLKEYDG